MTQTWVPPGAPLPNVVPPVPVQGAILRTRGRGGVFDLVCFPNAMIASFAGGSDPATLGAVIGLLLGMLIGAIVGGVIGEHIARTNAANRLPRLWYTPPEHLLAANKRNRTITAGDVRDATLWEYGKRQRLLRINLTNGRRLKYRFDAALHPNSYARASLVAALGPNVRFETRRARPASIVAAVLLTVLVLLILAAITVAVIGSGSNA